jgi:hypothetical protein
VPTVNWLVYTSGANIDDVEHEWNDYHHPRARRLCCGLRRPSDAVRGQVVHCSGSGDDISLPFLGPATVHQSDNHEEIPA